MPSLLAKSVGSLLIVLMWGCLLLPPVTAQPPVLDRLLQLGKRQGKQPHAAADPSIELLAENIDWLEHEIDRWGSVVAKTPDVWGAARLTKYRNDVEEQLRKDIGRFDEGRINGAQLIRDTATLTAAFQLSTAGATNTVPTGNLPAATLPNPFGLATLNIANEIALEQTQVLDQKKRYLDHLNELRRLNDGDDVSDAPGYALHLVRIPISIIPGKYSQDGYGAEITVTATPNIGPELLPIAYRDFVINDLVDQLSVPLTRFLNTDPAKARQLIDLLELIEKRPQVIADLNKQFLQGWHAIKDPLLQQVLEAYDLEYKYYEPTTGFFPPFNFEQNVGVEGLASDARLLATLLESISAPSFAMAIADKLRQDQQTREKGVRGEDAQRKDLDSKDPIDRVYQVIADAFALQAKNEGAAANVLSPTFAADAMRADAQPASLQLERFVERLQATSQLDLVSVERTLKQLRDLLADLNVLDLDDLKITTINIPSSTRRSTLPFPPSQLLDNYGLHEMGHVALDACGAFRDEIINRQIIHLSDVQAYLREELSGAYDMLSLPAMECFWTFEASGERTLVDALRHRRNDDVAMLRGGFRAALAPHLQHSSTLSLAWCIFVESLLLNERILEDMQATGACQHWLPLFGPNPPTEARELFAAYVAQRWPLQIFTVDPVTTEQNIADFSSVQRQMELAVALAFAGGEINAATAINTLRQLQRDTATIDLNRTVVGFAHGADTFGWRFYPRFQTPPVASNATVFFRDLVVGGPTDRQLERHRKLEPGMRECTAVILLPSFVPGVTFETRGNWFKLNNPAHTALSMKETVGYSRAVTTMREQAMACTRSPERYRPGELERLLNRVKQLEEELPLQTLRCTVPIENSHGGFEIFTSGSRELAPELLGWYGAPGYDIAKGGTFFLAGDNFSLHESKLIVGNAAHEYTLLSRQVMQVSLPPGLAIVQDERLQQLHAQLGLPDSTKHYIGFLDAHLATPYGVSGHLLIPVIETSDPPPPPVRASFGTTAIETRIEMTAKSGAPPTVSSDLHLDNGMPLVELLVPPMSNVAGQAARITLAIQTEDGPLTPVVVEGIPATGTSYRLDGSRAISLMTGRGALLVTVREYLNWLAMHTAPTAWPAEQTLALKCTLTAEINGITAAQRTVPFNLRIVAK